MSIRLLVGLSNPGNAYAQTRHNVGAWLVNAFVERAQLRFSVEKKFQADLASITLPDGICYVLRPLTFMNHNGTCVRAVSQFYRIRPQEILVVHDDLDLMPGRVKFKLSGGHGGHNGVRDVIAQLGTPDFHRLRIGIGHPGDKAQVVDYVLSAPNAVDRQAIVDSIHEWVLTMPRVLTDTGN